MSFSANELATLLDQTFPDDRPATFDELASLIQRVKDTLDVEQMPVADQRRYVTEVLGLETILMEKAFDAERPYTQTAEAEEAEVRETVQHWVAVFWPDDEKGGA
jgi:hypothetical protein